MTNSDLMAFFDERFGEIEEYLELLEDLDGASKSGPPKIEGTKAVISPSQQKILYSSLYLQLYNLVEATVSRCVEAVTDAAAGGKWRVNDLNSSMRQEWVRATARTHQVDMAPDNRLSTAIAMCDHVIEQLPLKKFQIEKGGGGNWDDESIFEMTKRIGCQLKITSATNRLVKKKIRDNLGAMQLVKVRRNNLAHGSISFRDCADDVMVTELRMTSTAVGKYLREAIQRFDSYIELLEFLQPSSKPAVNSGGVK